jgi:hypothetical protein
VKQAGFFTLFGEQVTMLSHLLFPLFLRASETVSHSPVNIAVFSELAKERVVVGTSKDVPADFSRPMVVDLIVYIWSQVGIVVRRGVEGKERQS